MKVTGDTINSLSANEREYISNVDSFFLVLKNNLQIIFW